MTTWISKQWFMVDTNNRVGAESNIFSFGGKLWSDDDFKCCTMDEKCQPLLDALESMKTCDENEERVSKA